MTKLNADEVLRFLFDIEEGRVTLKSDVPADEVFAGNVEYCASNGWTIVIFNDCTEWDYIDHIESDDGRSLDFDDFFAGEDGRVRNYMPPESVIRDVYGIGRT